MESLQIRPVPPAQHRAAETESLLLVGLFAALTAAGGWMKIPVPPVPVTLQTFFVYVSGLVLGSRRAVFSQCLFLAAGLAGLPVFAMGGGPGYIFQPTFGYLLAFPVAAAAAGKAVSGGGRKSGSMGVVSRSLRLVPAAAVILLFGAAYLYAAFQWIVHRPVTPGTVLLFGVIVVLPGELLKIILAAALSFRISGMKKGVT